MYEDIPVSADSFPINQDILNGTANEDFSKAFKGKENVKDYIFKLSQL